jgi:hypothetical protein
MECACGHDFWDHRAIEDMSKNGGGGSCTKCDCPGFVDQEDWDEAVINAAQD